MRPHRTFCLLAALLASSVVAAPASADTAQTRVIAGSNASDTQFPHQARLTVRRGTASYQCGAVIRDALHVMTAAHCLVDSGVVSAPSEVTVSYGSADRTRQLSAAVYAVEPAAPYVAGDISYDAALITLAAPLTGFGGATVQGVELATAAESATAVTAARPATVSGWGLTEDGSISRMLRSASVTLRADSVCQRTYGSRTFVASRFVCAGGTGTQQTGNADSCNGDSGGPLVTAVGSAVKLVGLVSFGSASGCGRGGVPAAYTEVSDPAVNAVLTGQTQPPASSTAPAPAPAVTTAPSAARPAPSPAPAAPAKPASGSRAPSASLAGWKCRKRVCVVRVKTKGSRVTASVARRTKRCQTRAGRRVCRTVFAKATAVKASRAGGQFLVSVKLPPASYRFTAVASDAAGRQSAPVAVQLRVRG